MGFQDDCLILSALFNVLHLTVHVLFETSASYSFSSSISSLLHILVFSPVKFEMHLCCNSQSKKRLV